MAKKPTLTDLTGSYGAQTTINSNNDKIEQAFENTLSRDGSTPNQMEADLDMNGNDVLNVKNMDVSNDLVVSGINILDAVSVGVIDFTFPDINQIYLDSLAGTPPSGSGLTTLWEEFYQRPLVFESFALAKASVINDSQKIIEIRHDGKILRFTRTNATADLTFDDGKKWVVAGPVVTPAHYEAVEGVDSAAELSTCFNSGKPIWIDGAYTSSAKISVTGGLDVSGSNPYDNYITFTGAVDGIEVTPGSWTAPVKIKNVGVYTTSVGTQTGIRISRLGMGAEGIPYFDYKDFIENCWVKGETNYTNGWKVAVAHDFPFGFVLINNQLEGYYQPSDLIASDFVTDSVGVDIEDQAVRTCASMKMDGNKIYGFMTGAMIRNVEGVWVDNNDLQVCYDGLHVDNTISKVNQYRLTRNHFGVSNRQVIFEDARSIILNGNEVSYRWGRTDGATINLMEFYNCYSVSIAANHIRGNISNDVDVVLRGIGFSGSTEDPVDLVEIVGNTFDRLSLIYVCVGTTGCVSRVSVAGNNYDGIRNDAYFDHGLAGSLSIGQEYSGDGTFTGIPKTANIPLTILTSNSGALRLGRDSDGIVLPFYRAGSLIGNISMTASAVAYNTTSDETLKEDKGILSPELAKEIISKIDVHTFLWKETGEEDEGFFAQELYKVYPRAVTKGGWVKENGEEYYVPWSVDKSALMPLVISCLQALINKDK